jgi:hypothetical protein
VVDAGLTTPSASLAGAKNHQTRRILKGKYGAPHPLKTALLLLKYGTSYVEMLEQQQMQLVAGLQELYRRCLDGKGWVGAPLEDSERGTPLTHDILERLGALALQGQMDARSPFDENLDHLRRRMSSHGACLEEPTLSDSGSDFAHSPSSDRSKTNTWSADSFSPGKLHCTSAASTSPSRITNSNTGSQLKLDTTRPQSFSASGIDLDPLRTSQWESPMSIYLDEREPSAIYDAPIDIDSNLRFDAFTVPGLFDATTAPQMPIGTIAPYLSMGESISHDINLHDFFGSSVIT